MGDNLIEKLRDLNACEPGCYGRCTVCPNLVAQEAAEAIERLTRERDEARGMVESLRETKDTFFRNAEAWETRAEAAEAKVETLTAALEKTLECLDVISERAMAIGLDGTIDWDSIAGPARIWQTREFARAALTKKGDHD